MNRVLSNIYEGMGKSASGDKEKHGPAIEVGLVSQPNTPPRDNQMKEPDAPSFESKRELTMAEAKDATGFAFSDLKKWRILSVIFIIQCSMNMNASIYGNAVSGLKGEFSIDNQMARTGQAVFLIAYAFGCELWAPWSEEYGRFPIMQWSLFLVNIFQIPCAVAKDYNLVIVARVLGGLSSAGGSVTLAVVADMFETDTQQLAVAFVSLSSVGGSVLGPIFGGFIEVYLDWRWVFWVSLIFGAVAQLLHYVLVPETRTTCLLDKEAKRRRKASAKAGEELNIWGPNEINTERIKFMDCVIIWWRPFEMFYREPIVFCLSLLSGFSDALIFTFLEAYHPVYAQYGFGPIRVGLIFVALLIGYIIAYFTFYPTMLSQRKRRTENPGSVPPEARLWWLQYLATLLPVGLFGYASTSIGPDYVPWWVPTIFTVLIGMANYGIYTGSVDYMIAAYGPYSASATGGNGFARDLLAGFAAWYSGPFYERFEGKWRLSSPSWILSAIAAVVCIPVFVIYRKGAWIRLKSHFAQTLEHDGVLQTHTTKVQEDLEKKEEEKEEAHTSTTHQQQEKERGEQQQIEDQDQDQHQQHQQISDAVRRMSVPNLTSRPSLLLLAPDHPRNMSVTSLSGRRGLTIRQQSFHGSFNSPYGSRVNSPVNSRPGSRQGMVSSPMASRPGSRGREL